MSTAASQTPHACVQHLLSFIEHHPDNRALNELMPALNNNNPDAIIAAYVQALPVMEDALWHGGLDANALAGYQGACREFEAACSLKGNDERHRFVVVIPVADRPLHLEQCLDSLMTLCELYRYGGQTGNRCSKLLVIVADDSKDEANMKQHARLCSDFSTRGLYTEYFGREQQRALLHQTSGFESGELASIVGTPALLDTCGYAHKGAAITRNITYLRLNKLINEDGQHRTLIYFVDSDQEFRIRLPTGSSATDIYALNYFHHLDEIFTRTDADILTGKVVGDPPVSPAVMVGKFLDDVIEFLRDIAVREPEQACSFHTAIGHETDDAAYHDMSELYGFKPAANPCEYHCTLSPPHDHIECFEDFAHKLNRFFDGQHPTRVTYFSYDGDLSATKPARTIYTGNYVFRPRMLEHFIAFATLKLRMAGPVLGRLLRADAGERFVSANLPMLHNRTVEATGVSECRPGVKRDSDNVDLAEEFERQFYGDVMLFTVDKLTQAGYPALSLDEAFIKQTLETTDSELRDQYLRKHEHTVQKMAELKRFYSSREHWWHHNQKLEAANSEVVRFMNNLEHNFGDASYGYELINTAANRNSRHADILQAIMRYADDRIAWSEALAAK